MITYDKVKIYSVRTDNDYYDHKKKKHIKYAKPKITKKHLMIIVLILESYICRLKTVMKRSIQK